jgi:hypothetical protein
MRGTTKGGIWFLSVMGYIGIAIITFHLWESTGGLDCSNKKGHCTDVATSLWPLFLPIWVGIHKPLLFWSCVAGIGGSLLWFHQIKAFFRRLEYRPIWQRKKVLPHPDEIEIEAAKEVNKLLER